ncbi:LacI family DNA-binding transcriptional regulator [Arenivirga flava]|uniref:LacI family transcriptional regulator n=1 Tax=Arenivirga flava TaxID=1930060 RepID=A0AA37UF81_9MICO|nr:LacI family DNA-binding transcriptional regulator [Arenivirga flava]GMA29199.1 LacI family transcriptional regulator [Arenivirga flava]
MTDPGPPATSGQSRAPNIRDVAREAGVSYQTVSRVINGSPSIRPATRQKVLDAIDELGYRPNQAARALVTSRSRVIGVLLSDARSYGPSFTLQSIEVAARAKDYFVSTATIALPDPPSIRSALDHLMRQNIDGLVVIAPQTRVFDAIQQLSPDLPLVTLEASGRKDGHTIAIDQEQGARLATRHLIELGHTEIEHLAGPQDWIEAQTRMDGFLAEIRENDLGTRPPILGDWTADFGYYAGTQMLGRFDFTAVFASNDQMALGVLHAFRDAGLDVPGDVSVVGFDDVPDARHFWPPLTTVRQRFELLGARCVDMLLGQIEGDEQRYHELIAAELVVRGSTAPPPPHDPDRAFRRFR